MSPPDAAHTPDRIDQPLISPQAPQCACHARRGHALQNVCLSEVTRIKSAVQKHAANPHPSERYASASLVRVIEMKKILGIGN